MAYSGQSEIRVRYESLYRYSEREREMVGARHFDLHLGGLEVGVYITNVSIYISIDFFFNHEKVMYVNIYNTEKAD